jgi:NADH dehydrogenase FAD-containing subunit
MDGAGTQQHIVIAGAGYAGLHVALRLAARLGRRDVAELTLVDQHDYHQPPTELPRVAAGTRQADAVRIPLEQVLAQSVRFIQTKVTGFDLAGRRLLTQVGPLPYTRLVLALGSRPNDFAIPGLVEVAGRTFGGGSPTSSKTLSSGNTANRSRTCAAGARCRADRVTAAGQVKPRTARHRG